LDEIEKPSSSLFVKTYKESLNTAIDTLQTAINNKDEEKIKSYRWNLNIGLSGNLWGEWLMGWNSGSKTGKDEIEAINDFSRNPAPIALFNQPEAESSIIRNRPAEKAIKERINTLAKDVSDSEWREIKKEILASIKPQSETKNPINRRELLKKINDILGDRANRFKNRADRIARTELTFAYNAGRLDSYVRSGLVSGVKYQTIFDERRCKICASRQGIIVALDDVDGIAEMAIPAHPNCRCVWSPVLKTEFDKESKIPARQLKNRNPVKSKKWLAGGILAALLLPEELFLIGGLGFGLKKLITKAGSTVLARAAIAKKFNDIFGRGKVAAPAAKAPGKVRKGRSVTPNIVAPGVNLNIITAKEWRSLIPDLTQEQLNKLIKNVKRNQFGIKEFEGGLSKLSTMLTRKQWLAIRNTARNNTLLNVLHPENNYNSSAIWVNSGGIISKQKSRVIYDLIQTNLMGTIVSIKSDFLNKYNH